MVRAASDDDKKRANFVWSEDQERQLLRVMLEVYKDPTFGTEGGSFKNKAFGAMLTKLVGGPNGAAAYPGLTAEKV